MTKKEKTLKLLAERFKREYLDCRLCYQYIEFLTDPKNLYLFEEKLGFFIHMYKIYVDYFAIKVFRLFDKPGKGERTNFSIKKIEEDLNAIGSGLSFVIPDRQEEGSSFKKLEEYRNKHLAHLDYEKERNHFAPHQEVSTWSKDLLDVCHTVYEKLESLIYNKDIGISETLEMHPNYHINNILSLGVFLSVQFQEHGDKDEIKSIEKQYLEWNNKNNLRMT